MYIWLVVGVRVTVLVIVQATFLVIATDLAASNGTLSIREVAKRVASHDHNHHPLLFGSHSVDEEDRHRPLGLKPSRGNPPLKAVSHDAADVEMDLEVSSSMGIDQAANAQRPQASNPLDEGVTTDTGLIDSPPSVP